MRADVYFTAGEVEAAALQQRTVVVIDVLRATTTIVEALANGARAIYPTSGTEDAIKLANSLGREDTLLCGERRGVKIEGYDLGNSPAEFTPERIADKRCVMNTTNGTRAFLAAAGARRVLAASFLNIGAVARAVASAGGGDAGDDEHGLAVICAGREGGFSMEDAVCAGVLLRRLEEEDAAAGLADVRTLGDAARAATTLADSVSIDADFLRGTDAGRNLVSIGHESDLALCARLDVHDVVPEMHDRMIRLPGRP